MIDINISELIAQELISLELAADAANTTIKTLITPVFNVVGYGAKGDGVTDDTASIQALLDSLTSGGSVFFPKTTAKYKITSVLTIPYDNILIFGEGVSSKIEQTTNFQSIFNAEYKNNIVIKDLYLYGTGDGDGDTQKWGTGVIFRSCVNSKIRNCKIENFGKGQTLERIYVGIGGIWLRESCKNCEVSNNYILQCNNAINEDAYLASSGSGPSNNIISNNRLLNNRIHILCDDIGYGGELTYGAQVTNNYIEGHFSSVDVERVGIKSDFVKSQVIANNTIRDCLQGISIEGYNDGITISGNNIENSGTGILTKSIPNFSGPQNININGNNITGTGSHGIALYQGDRINIVANIINKAVGKAILCNADNALISSNVITEGGSHGISIEENDVTVLIEANIIKGNISDTSNLNYGIYVVNASAAVKTSNNYIENENTDTGFKYGINALNSLFVIHSEDFFRNMRTAGLNPPDLPATQMYNPRFSNTMTIYGPTTTTSATAGSATALPATPVSYLTINFDGTDYKIPIYNA